MLGTDEGEVSCWDLRSGRPAWRQQLSSDYIAGLSCTSLTGGHDTSHVLAAAGDGTVAILDLRMADRTLAAAKFAAAPGCCAAAGGCAVIGFEDGSMGVWDMVAAAGAALPSSAVLQGTFSSMSIGTTPSGFQTYDAACWQQQGCLHWLHCDSASSVNGICLGDASGLVAATPGAEAGAARSGNRDSTYCKGLGMVAVQDDGSLTVLDHSHS